MNHAAASAHAIADVQCCQAQMFITDVQYRCSTPKFNTDIHHRIENGAKRCGKPFDN